MKKILIVALLTTLGLVANTTIAKDKSRGQRNFTPAEIAISPFGQDKAIWQEFSDDGDIDRHNKWWGLTILGYKVHFDENDKSNSVMVNTQNTIKEVRTAGNVLCGFSDASWVRRNDPDGKVLLDAENTICKAGIDNFVYGEKIITISIKRK
jgi:hypothetical protein